MCGVTKALVRELRELFEKTFATTTTESIGAWFFLVVHAAHREQHGEAGVLCAIDLAMHSPQLA